MKEITNDSEFAEIFNSSQVPIILDFYTDTCNPCKTLMPILEKLAFENKNDITFLKTKANENVVLAKQLGVTSVPTLIIVTKNKEIERAKGLITEKSLRDHLEKILS